MNHDSFRVVGGTPLRGVITPQGNKNEALPLLAACCLTDELVTLENVPAIEDVSVMASILQALGVNIESSPDQSQFHVQAKTDPCAELPHALCDRLRGSVTLAGPMLARRGRVVLPKPGGDRIGRRRLDTHLLALQALGAKVIVRDKEFELQADELRGADILLDEASVTATENALCAAVFARGETILQNAASEPHVQGLCRFLQKMGAKIEGIGSNVLRIYGVSRLHGCTHRLNADYVEVGSFIAAVAATHGELTIHDANIPDLRMIREVFARLGVQTVVHGNDLVMPRNQSLEISADLGGAIPTIDDAPWPGFPADLISVTLVAATQCTGTILFHEKLFESRMFFVDSLIAMGARVILCDPHRAVVIGPDRLRAARLSSPDIRAGMALLIAALCAEGESVIQNVDQIDRGYSRIDERLRQLGAQIERIAQSI